MDDRTLLYVAIGVFTLMAIGLALTIREFRTNIIVEQSPDEAADKARPAPSATSLERAV